MDNERKDPLIPENDNWLDEILGTSAPVEEIGPDEHAVSSAGLTHPDDLELERILAEDWDSIEPIAEEATAETAQPAAEPAAQEETKLFTVPQDEIQEEPQPAQEPEMQEEQPAPAPKRRSRTKEAVRKGRPKPKKGYGLLGIPHILSTLIWLVIIVAVGVSLGRTLWVCCADLMAFGKESQEVTITITETDDIDSISEKLGKAGLVRYPQLFKLFAQLTGKDENISVGTFTLNAHLDYNAMINSMGSYSSEREVVTVMVPEGYTCAQIFALLEEKGVCAASDLEAYCVDGELDEYWFLEGMTRGDKYCLEGYLFPDTYDFYTNDSPRRVLEKFLDAFDYRFTDLMKSKLEPLNQRVAAVLSARGYGQDYINEHKITIREIVIIASMIEKETASVDESYTISSVIYNRLTNPANYPYLNIDATLIYALGGNIDPATGERKPLTNADKEMDNPYNTYKYTGLIPGPISNPGRDSLNAALEPLETSYYYYVYNPNTGVHIFAKTYSEHEKNVNYVNSLG